MIPRRVELELEDLRDEYMEDPVTEKYIYKLLDEIENLKKQIHADGGIVDFLEENAPVYDDWRNVNDKYCCEKMLLQERERLKKLAQEELK